MKQKVWINQYTGKKITDNLDWKPTGWTKETDSRNVVPKRMSFVCEEVQDFRFFSTWCCFLLLLARILAPLSGLCFLGSSNVTNADCMVSLNFRVNCSSSVVSHSRRCRVLSVCNWSFANVCHSAVLYKKNLTFSFFMPDLPAISPRNCMLQVSSFLMHSLQNTWLCWSQTLAWP